GTGSFDPEGSAQLPIRTAVASPEYESAIDSSRAVLRAAAAEGVGVAAAVAVEGEIIWLEGAGYADRTDRAPVDPGTTRFRVYSVTKPMTAAAPARLMERGRLDPSAPVQRYVSDFPEHPAHPTPITPMHLATHTSGIRHYADEGEAANRRHCETVEEALTLFRDDPLVHPPGDGETYSSWGYVLLSAVLEGATASTYSEVMEEWVFEPTGMARTVLDDPTATVEGRAAFYEEVEGGEEPDRLRPAEPVDNTCKWGAGAYLSTAGDVARFGAAMLDPGFLSPPSLELFMRGEDVYRAQGVGAGGAAFLVVDRGASLIVALLSNAVGEGAGPAAQRATAAIHDWFREAD
ncbi:MAG: serine hydrolase domain-containing protein, partial [Longimicrobiales bacterium]|nr:serine hydrolase domain-containing protein [Longimicrobiales bacterium]